MLGGLMLATAGVVNGGAFGNLLYSWEQMGMFAYVLPFLLIFAVVFGILERTSIFDAKGVNVIIAVVVGLMSLQFQMVSVFFSEIFPRLGIGLSVILVILILVGMFMPVNKSWVTNTLFAIAAVVAFLVISKSLSFVGWTTGTWWSDNWVSVVTVAGILGLIGAVVGSGGSDEEKKLAAAHAREHPVQSILTAALKKVSEGL